MTREVLPYLITLEVLFARRSLYTCNIAFYNVFLSISSQILKVTSYLHNNNVAHNVLLARGQPLSDRTNSDAIDVLRIFIWARKPQPAGKRLAGSSFSCGGGT